MSTTPHEKHFTLYSWTASDASCRVRLALALKGIQYQLHEVDLSKERLVSSVNPARTVPTLVVSSKDSEVQVSLTDSIAALEYLEESFPNTTPLLPPISEPSTRARTRALMNVIATDTHPLTTHRVSHEISNLIQATAGEGQIREWTVHWIRRGLRIYENLISDTAGIYSVGDSITLADVCLWAQVSTAIKFGVTLANYPRIASIIEKLNRVQSFHNDPHVRTEVQ